VQSKPLTNAQISIVIPVYQGEKTLQKLIFEIEPLTRQQRSPDGNVFVISEVVLVHDCGPDDSASVMRSLAEKYSFVQTVWLSRNFGQHPATLAGMAGSTGDFVVTMDEDGQQDPKSIGALLDAAKKNGAQLVYARPSNPPPHGWLRNALSIIAKRIATILIGNRDIAHINSFRLIDGEIARSLAAYCGSGVFLDVALFWMVARTERCPVILRPEMGRPSGYSFVRLLRHFWQLLLTSGTRPLRIITCVGFLSLILAILISAYALYVKFSLEVPVQGWTSIVIVVSFFSGCILTALGIIAEYLAVTMAIVMGRPLYVVTTKPVASKKS
jgi:polyisoprenyl-phosphate glycosyltransferase